MSSKPPTRRSSQVSVDSGSNKRAPGTRRNSEVSSDASVDQRKKSNASSISIHSQPKTKVANTPDAAATKLSEDPPTVLTELYYQYNKKRNLLIQPCPQDYVFIASLPKLEGSSADVSLQVAISTGTCPFVRKDILDHLPAGHKAFVDTNIPNGYENVRHPFGKEVNILGRTVVPICFRDMSTRKLFKIDLCAIVLDKMPLPLYINKSHPAVQRVVDDRLLPLRFALGGPMYYVEVQRI